jgi:hypothetical protein
MCGADTVTEGLFILKKLDDLVPASRPMRAIRTMSTRRCWRWARCSPRWKAFRNGHYEIAQVTDVLLDKLSKRQFDIRFLDCSIKVEKA